MRPCLSRDPTNCLTRPSWVGAHTAPSFDYAAKHNFHVAQNIDVDPVIAENFEYWRNQWKAQSHSGPMPKSFLTRAVHVAETDAKAREQAEPALLVSLNAGSELIRRLTHRLWTPRGLWTSQRA